MHLVINSIIERLNVNLETEVLLRVLWISDDKKNVVVVNINDHRKMTLPFFLDYEDMIEELEAGMSRIIELEVDMQLLSPDDDYLDKYKANRNRRWELIKDIVKKEPEIYLPEKRGKLITEAHLTSNKPKKVIRNYLKKYWYYGKTINGLLDNYFDCGVSSKRRNYRRKPGRVSDNRYLVTESDKINFISAIKLFHKRQGMNIKTTHERMCETYYKRGFYRKYGVRVPIVNPDQAPTLRQFRYWYTQNSTLFSRYSNRHGKRRASIDVRPMQGNSSERASCVGAVFEIDATRSDVLLVSFDRKTILGKPTLYIVIDVFSRLVVGYHVSLASESWLEAMIAMEHAATSKVENCKKFGIDITEEEWPCHALPKYLVGDRGELKAQYTERFVNLEVDVLNAPSYRGDLKPFVESRFHITNETIRQLLPGSTEAQPKVRGDHDPARDAVLTIEEFNRFLIVFFMTYNKSAVSEEFKPTKEMFVEKVELTPLKIWSWGKGKRLLHEKTRSEIRYNLLPRAQGKVTRFGIEFKDLYYTCDIGLKEGWFEGEGRINGQKYIEISYDPRNCSSIFLKHKKGLIQCSLTGQSKEYEGLHFEEIAKITEYKNEEIKQQEKNEKQHKAELHAYTQQLNKTAIKETKEVINDKSFYSRQQNKRQRRHEDSRTWGAQNAWSNPEANLSPVEAEKSRIIPFPNDEAEETSLIDMHSKDVQALFSAKNRDRRRKHNDE
ncbi:Mu transposase C-terminal domain-containing protein [Paenibacillus pasadenensis]|uniref:Mu transposase C-terminal domain-containing protein n=1 Tax=Paenibacillus pasadenensis TaxID=217090 RepID=UPI00040D15C7|nr:Mu transposase C-terminal domain-containing protein [Paenibacillus pasadenensis]